MNYWLVKSEPGTYSWDDLVKDRETIWDGVRNFQARRNIKSMKEGDPVFFYHSGADKAIVGIATVVTAPYADPKDNEWAVVDISPKKKLKNPVTLAQIKADKRLTNMVLARAPRLSVQPVSPKEFEIIRKLSETR